MKDNLLLTLLRHASSRGSREEDSITETLAWLLHASGPLRGAFVERLRTANTVQHEPSLPTTPARIETQVTERASDGSTCRYDLVLHWRDEAVRAIVEVKVDAALGWRPLGTDADSEPVWMTQVEKYIATSNLAGRVPTRVFTLGPSRIDVSAATAANPAYGGAITWYEVAAMLEAPMDDPVATRLARWFKSVLKERGMTPDLLTKESLEAVRPYLNFKRSIDVLLERAFETLKREGALQGFQADKAWWQEAHERVGYVIPARDKAAGHLLFLGVSVWSGALTDGAPDLLLFLETPPKGEAHKRITHDRAEWAGAVAKLDADASDTRWWWNPDGWQPVVSRRDMAWLVGEADQLAAVTAFYRKGMVDLRGAGLLDRFAKAITP